MSLKDYIDEKPQMETKRLLLRTLIPEDVEDLKEWLSIPSLYQYWGKEAR